MKCICTLVYRIGAGSLEKGESGRAIGGATIVNGHVSPYILTWATVLWAAAHADASFLPDSGAEKYPLVGATF